MGCTSPNSFLPHVFLFSTSWRVLSGLLDEAEQVRFAGRAPLLPAGGRVPHVLRKEVARQNAQERGMNECAKKPVLCANRNQRITFVLLQVLDTRRRARIVKGLSWMQT